jgi:hypothetical protein
MFATYKIGDQGGNHVKKDMTNAANADLRE